ncbi:FAD-binding oxidoreductase [Halomicrococcus sp. NG-SE-24]|uniref:FAD-binding oxidoreductase n=1 Tax=Halomicrococcus sp. NG-SE-24 TaxID=3436928 RepID=UPI003D95D425
MALSNPHLETNAIAEFQAELQGDVISRNGPKYDEARAVWNGMVDKYPALIAQCTGVGDVVQTVTFARENDLLVAVRGGGHNVAGTAVCDDGIVIDLSEMNGVVVHPDDRTARVQAGATWGEMDRETQHFGLVTPGGVISMTGVAGLTLGGGYSHLRRKYGLTADNLRSVNIVTADGEFLTANEEQHEDLFWALRGGGGNFGVVTSFEFELHELGPEVMHAGTAYPMKEAPSVLRQWRDFMQDAPDEITSDALLWSIPEHEHFPPDLHGTPVIITAGVYAGPVDEGRQALQPLREFKEPLLDLSRVDPYTDVQQQFDPFFQQGVRAYWKSRYLNSLDERAIETIVEYASDRPSPRSPVPIRARGGKLNRIDSEATAFWDRRSPFQLSIDATWTLPEGDEENIEWTREFWEAMEPHASDTMYFNFASGDEDEEIIRTTFGQNYTRLVEVKTEYDPENLFQLNTNIQPTT